MDQRTRRFRKAWPMATSPDSGLGTFLLLLFGVPAALVFGPVLLHPRGDMTGIAIVAGVLALSVVINLALTIMRRNR